MADPLEISDQLALPPEELRFETSRSSGPGGQNVNKVESRVTLRFDVEGSPSLAPEQRAAIRQALSSRINVKGELLVSSQQHRTQMGNRRAATERFVELLRAALAPRVPRRATKPSRASVERRKRAKRRRSQLKRDRSGKDWTN